MSILSLSRALQKSAVSGHRPHRATRLVLRCEPLENRQLLAVAQASLGTLAVSNPVAAQTQISVPTVFHGIAPTGFTAIDIEIGAISGLSQIQIAFTRRGTGFSYSFGEGQAFSFAFGGDEVFSPSGSSAFSESTLGFGAGNGSPVTSDGGSAGGNIFAPSSSLTPSSTSITPLNPSLTAATGSSSGTPVSVVPPPLMPIAVHLAASALRRSRRSRWFR